MSGTGGRVWPLRLAATEGVAAARTGRWTSLLVVIAVAWIIAAPAAADAVAVTHLITGEQAWLKAGGTVFVVTGSGASFGEGRPIPVSVCERLTGLPGVRASFALQVTGASAGFAHVPGQQVALYRVSPGALVFFGVAPSSRGAVIASDHFAQLTGVQDGDPVRLMLQDATSGPGTPDGGMVYFGGPINPAPDVAARASTGEVLTVRVASTAAMDAQMYAWTLLLPTPLTGSADYCFVRTDSAHHAGIRAALAAYLGSDKPASTRPTRQSDEFTVDYSTAYGQRALRWAWVAAAVMLGVLWAMLQWFRRSQVAIYATFGMRAAPRLMMQASEWAVLAGLGVLWGWSIGVVGALALGARAEAAVAQVSYHAALTVLGASVLVVLMGLRPTGTLLTALKDH